ncbi:MAG: elongation factor Ts [Gammaproteobacteria bacterium]|nr:elongation factor Ts [Gammaproteobacteria bacterium]
MTITAQQVKELRERTGVGMMECKKALLNTAGDVDKAIEEMRKSGLAKAAKKASRIAAEGVVVVTINEKQAAITEINSETDFVAKDDSFMGFAQQVSQQALTSQAQDVDTLMAESTEKGTLEDARQALIATIGENIKVRRTAYISSNDVTGSYCHGNKIGVIVAMQGGNVDLAKDIAMHIAASNPQVVAPSDVSAEAVDKEKEIFTAQALASGKPANIAEKMVEGRIKKFLNEISLLGQPFVKNPDATVEQTLQQADATVSRFIRFEVGEGIEKKVDNFADEVMAQVQGSAG